jgi:hypothetical protein
MKKITSYIMRVTLIALVIQVICPLFVSAVSINAEFHLVSSKASMHTEKHSVNLPALLKEKEEESENEDKHSDIVLIPLIDFSDLESVLSRYHNSKITRLTSLDCIDRHPPLFTLHRVFLI